MSIAIRERPGARVRIFPLFDQEILDYSSQMSSVDGISITEVQTSNQLGSPDGNFKFALKGRLHLLKALEEKLQDDDWVGLELFRNDRPYAVMLGPISTWGLKEGPYPAAELTIHGNQFGSIFNRSRVFWDPIIDQLFALEAEKQVFASSGAYPSDAVGTWLWGYLAHSLGTIALPPNRLPASLAAFYAKSPLKTGDTSSVKDLISFFAKDFRNDPYRAHMIQFGNPQNLLGHSVWDLAESWSDEPLCELYCDLVRFSNNTANPPVLSSAGGTAAGDVSPAKAEFLRALGRGQGLTYWRETSTSQSLEDSVPAVIYRNRPFPTTSFQGPDHPNYWRNLPRNNITEGEFKEPDLKRSGIERRNAVYLSTSDPGAFAAVLRQIAIVNRESVRNHGFKRLNPNCKFNLSAAPIGADSEPAQSTSEGLDVYQKRVRDFNCMNHLFRTGTVPLTHLRPDIRVGNVVTRIHTDSATAVAQYYVEEVRHMYKYGKGQTMLGVTRGWNGTDETLEAELGSQQSGWELVTTEHRANEVVIGKK